MRLSVITVSDSCSAGLRKDLSGPAIVEMIQKSSILHAPTVNAIITVPDERAAIETALLQRCEDSEVIITTGGTGFAERDVTPEIPTVYVQDALGQTRSVTERPSAGEWVQSSNREMPRCGKNEATINVVDRRCTGLEVALHSRSLSATPMAALSRAVAGIRGTTLIVNFPGSVKAAKEYWEVVEPILNHGVDLLHKCDDGSLHAAMAKEARHEERYH